MKTLNLMLCGLVAATLLGCRGCGTGTGTVFPDIVATPTAVSFEACPSRDEGGAPVPDVFPTTLKVNLSNQAKAGADLDFTITGAGAASFSLGTPDGGGVPASIDSLGMVELPITFAPTARGDVRADLTVDDNTPESTNAVVTLIGTGINLPSQAKVETAPQKRDRSGFTTCTADTPLSECTLEFPDTMMDQSDTLQLKIRNRGCPALKITGLEIESSGGGTEGFEISSPAVLPSPTAPILLSAADGTEEITITVRFTATDDNSGSTSQGRFASLVIKSNDPLVGNGSANPARLSLQAFAVKPSIYVSPTSCNFTNAQDGCGNSPRIANKGSFRVTNDGSTPITISAVRFRSSGGTTSSNSRFSVTQNIQGQVIQPTAFATVELTEVDNPLLVLDTLEIVADAQGQGAGSAGTVFVSLVSGIKPCLTTEPMDTMDFGDPAEELTAQTLRIRNGASCGTLTVGQVSVDPTTFYTLIDPIIPPNSTVAPGGMLETTVQYRRPPSGGMQLATLTITSNDTDYGPPSNKQIMLQSAAAFDPIPIANLTACAPAALVNDPNCAMGASGATSFQLSMIDPDVITLSGVNSTDNGQVREYRFTLLPQFPSGVTGAVIANHGLRIMQNKTTLTIPPGAIGTYRVQLEVWDERGQKSGAPSIMTINVYQ